MAVETMVEHSEQMEIEQYRSVSVLAVLAFVGGLLSFTALAHPVLWCLPVVVILVALLAVRGVAKSEGSLTGHRLAVLGIALATIAGSMAITRIVVAKQIQIRHAQRVADQWLEMIRAGQDQLAHQWTVPLVLRVSKDTSLGEAYEDEDRSRAFTAFMEKEPVSSFAVLDDQAEYEFQQRLGVDGNRARRYFSLRYRMLAENHERDGHTFDIVLAHRDDTEYKLQWWEIDAVSWSEQ